MSNNDACQIIYKIHNQLSALGVSLYSWTIYIVKHKKWTASTRQTFLFTIAVNILHLWGTWQKYDKLRRKTQQGFLTLALQRWLFCLEPKSLLLNVSNCLKSSVLSVSCRITCWSGIYHMLLKKKDFSATLTETTKPELPPQKLSCMSW